MSEHTWSYSGVAPSLVGIGRIATEGTGAVADADVS